jgi:hypothetical protein
MLIFLITLVSPFALATSFSELDHLTRKQIKNYFYKNEGIEIDSADIKNLSLGSAQPKINCDIKVHAEVQTHEATLFRCTVCFEQKASLMGELRLNPQPPSCEPHLPPKNAWLPF